MHIALALNRKRDEIASTIAAYEARIAAARIDLAALDQAARLFDSEADNDELCIHRELGRHRTSQSTPGVEGEVFERDQPAALRQLALPAGRARASDDEHADPAKSIDLPEVQVMEESAYSATRKGREQIPAEFFYLNWP